MEIDFVLSECVYFIGSLPQRPSVLLETLEEMALLQAETESWAAISLWLRSIMLGEEIKPEAYIGDALYQMHYANWLKALFDLITALHSRSGNVDIRSFTKPSLLWYHCVCAASRRDLENTGITGLPTAIIPKRENYKAVTQLCTNLEKLRWQSDHSYSFEEWPEAIILIEAQLLAKDDVWFRHNSFRAFTKRWRAIAKDVKECQYLQGSCLFEREMFTTGKHRKLPSNL